MVTWFGDQQEREAPCGQLLDERLLGVKAVGDDNCRHPRIVGAEPLQHPVAGIDFAILLMVPVWLVATLPRQRRGYRAARNPCHHRLSR